MMSQAYSGAMPFSTRLTKHCLLTRAISIALLSVALVGAQIAGLAHRVVHAGPDGQSSISQAVPPQDADGNWFAHNCAAYDAATLVNGPPLLQAAWSAAPPPRLVLATFVVTVADGSPNLPFHPRAPPHA